MIAALIPGNEPEHPRVNYVFLFPTSQEQEVAYHIDTALFGMPVQDEGMSFRSESLLAHTYGSSFFLLLCPRGRVGEKSLRGQVGCRNVRPDRLETSVWVGSGGAYVRKE